MTPARNTSHWSITFLKSFQLFNDLKYLDASKRALDYLISDEIRPMKGSFWHRSHPSKNSYNGLIGQCWTLEALYYGYLTHHNSKYLEVSYDVFKKHKFEKSLGLWWQLKLDGSPGNIEYTLNQQIWFAAIGCLFNRLFNYEFNDDIILFLNLLLDKINLRRGGLLRNSILKSGVMPSIKWNLKQVVLKNHNIQFLNNLQSAYHIFALCGLALIKEEFPDHQIWSTKKFKRILRYVVSDKFSTLIDNNSFSYPYNVTGFEIPFILRVFYDFYNNLLDVESVSKSYIKKQIYNHYSFDDWLLNKNSSDADTLSARFYEIFRIPDILLVQMDFIHGCKII